MADKQIGELEPATGIFDETKIPGDQQGTAVYMTGAQIKEYAASVFPRFKVPDGGEFGQALLRASPTTAIWGDVTNSFNGRTGMVKPQSGDYTAEMVGADEAGSAANAKAEAIDEAKTYTMNRVDGLGIQLMRGIASATLATDDGQVIQTRDGKEIAAWWNQAAIYQQAAEEVAKKAAEEAVKQISIPRTEKGIAGGVATLDNEGKLSSGQVPALDYIPNNEKGIPGGVAELGQNGKVPTKQLPDLNYLPLAGGIMTGAIELANAPEAPMQPATKKYVDEKVSSIDPGVPDEVVQGLGERLGGVESTINTINGPADMPGSVDNKIATAAKTTEENAVKKANEALDALRVGYQAEINELTNTVTELSNAFNYFITQTMKGIVSVPLGTDSGTAISDRNGQGIAAWWPLRTE